MRLLESLFSCLHSSTSTSRSLRRQTCFMSAERWDLYTCEDASRSMTLYLSLIHAQHLLGLDQHHQHGCRAAFCRRCNLRRSSRCRSMLAIFSLLIIHAISSLFGSHLG